MNPRISTADVKNEHSYFMDSIFSFMIVYCFDRQNVTYTYLYWGWNDRIADKSVSYIANPSSNPNTG